MLVCVTGGTGFVGAHSVAAIVAAGHRVRLLIRDPAGARPALDPLGVRQDQVDVVAGDIRDARAVATAVRGADAVLHAGSVYSFDARRGREVRETNVAGTDVVLAAARRAAANPIVYLSTFGALLPVRDRRLLVSSPVGQPPGAYLGSKAAAEAIARRHQEQGAPVVIAYPPGLLGPHDPRLGDQVRRLRDLLRGLLPVWPLGGFPVGDVRDTAVRLAALVTAPGDSGRHVMPGRFLTTRQYVQVAREVTGRPLPSVFLPARPMLPLGRLVDTLQRVWPWHIPAEHGAIYTCAHATWFDEHAEGRPVAATMADTVRWLHATGRLSARRAGALAADSTADRPGNWTVRG